MPDTHLIEAARLEAPAPLYTGPNWDFTGLRKVYDAVERIALDELGLDVYPVQIEVITSEQMLDAYASVVSGSSLPFPAPGTVRHKSL